MPAIPQESSQRRSALTIALFLLAVAAALLTLPYLFPVQPAISLSYIYGYSNRAAVLILLLGIAAFALFTRGDLAAMDTEDSPLPLWMLYASLLIVVLFFVGLSLLSHRHLPITSEDAFFLDRQQTLATGQRLYRDFDFMYGPLLLYPGLWLARLFHCSQVDGYFAWLFLQWMLGTGMVWLSCKWIDLPSRFRPLLFGLLIVGQFPALPTLGSNYTPFRGTMALFLALLVLTVSRRNSGWKTAITAVLALGLGLACSPEQAIGLACGLSGYLILLAWKERRLFSPLHLGVCFAGFAACFAVAAWGGMFISFKSWFAGGFAFPLLPSVNNLLRLFPYAVAGCLFYRAVRERRWNSAAIVLPLAGAAMLPYALGRCDIGHLSSATPAFDLGIAGILAMHSLRRWWLPTFILICFFFPLLIGIPNRLGSHLLGLAARYSSTHSPSVPPPFDPGVPRPAPDDDSSIPEADMPCDQTYFAPTLLPSPETPFRPACLDRGYFRSISDDVFNSEAIERKIDEMRRRPSEPLLLENLSLPFLFRPRENDPTLLRILELSVVTPPARHPPVTFDPLREYIQTHYTPGPLVVRNHLRIWYPIAPAPGRPTPSKAGGLYAPQALK